MRKVIRVVCASVLAISASALFIDSAQAAACVPTITKSGNYKYLTFTDTSATCTWTVPAGMTLASTILIVGGGGGAGYYGNAGGGGAGALVVATNFSLIPGTSYDITIGAGGAGSSGGRGLTGNPTSFGTVTATGGGYGAGGDPAHYSATYPLVNNGGMGGSGGGGSNYNDGSSHVGIGGSSNASIGISSPWVAFGNSGAGSTGGGGGAGAAATNGTGGAGKTYFGKVYAKGGSTSGNNYLAGSGNGGSVVPSGGAGSEGSITIEIPFPVFNYANSSVSTPTGTAFPNNTINSTGSIITSYSITPALPSDLSLDSSGQIIGTPYTAQGSSTYTVIGTDAAGETGTTTLSLTITAGVARLTFSSISNVTKGTTINLVITAPAMGKIRFYANSKRIPGCLSIATTGVSPFTATCKWKPTTQASVKLTASLIAGSSIYSSGSAIPIEYIVTKRSSNR